MARAQLPPIFKEKDIMVRSVIPSAGAVEPRDVADLVCHDVDERASLQARD